MPEFAVPLWLLLLPAPAVVWWLTTRRRSWQDRDGALIHPLAGLIDDIRPRRRRIVAAPWLWSLGCMLLVVALARPQWIDVDPEDAGPGHNLLFAIDVSGSMRILDYRLDGQAVSRLDMLKSALAGFLERAQRLRAGVVVYADDVMTVVPLTTDLALAAEMVAGIDNSLGGERTAIGDAIALSLRRLQAVTDADASRVLVLLTDGVPTAGTIAPLAAADLARAAGVRILTVGLGSEDPAPFPLGIPGEQTVADIPLDEPFLRELAGRTGGSYVRIRDSDDLLAVFAELERLETTPLPSPVVVRDLYWLPAVFGLALLVLAERRRPVALPA